MQNETVLVVDDEVHLRRIAELSLASIGGMRVLCAGSGAEALALMAGTVPDVIVLDVMMPSMDGPTLLQHLRAMPALTETPVIFMTAKAEPAEGVRLRSLGAVGVITKPFEPMTFAHEVRSLVRAARTPGAP